MKIDFELPRFDGCACGSYENDNYRIETHCHRSSCGDCHYAGVHYEANNGYAKLAREHARKIRDYIAKAYWCDCSLIKGLR